MKNNIFVILSIAGLLFGLTSLLPIWPGPLIYRHLTPGIISGISIIIACLGTIKEDSKIVKIIGLVYGILTTLGGGVISYIFTTSSTQS